MNFELRLVKSLKAHYERLDTPVLVYRVPMIRYNAQGFDVHSDAYEAMAYCAYECKSITWTDPRGLYFSSAFHVSKGVHQLEHENEILRLSGRIGWLAIELKRERTKFNTVSFIPFDQVYRMYKSGIAKIPTEMILTNQRMEYANGLYHFVNNIEENQEV